MTQEELAERLGNPEKYQFEETRDNLFVVFCLIALFVIGVFVGLGIASLIN